MELLGYLAAFGFGLLCLYMVVIGARDGIMGKRIRIGNNDHERILEGLHAKLWGWLLVVVGSCFLIALLWALLGPYVDFV